MGSLQQAALRPLSLKLFSQTIKIMNRTTLYFLLLAAICVFTSCSSDDDANSFGTPGSIDVAKAPGVLTTEDGKQMQITYANGKTISYDDLGRVKSVGRSKFSYNPFTISLFGDSARDIKQNAKGYITSMKYVESDNDDTASFLMNYDDRGHLTKLSYSKIAKYISVELTNIDVVLTWSNGNLQKIVTTCVEKSDDSYGETTITYVFGYSSSGNSNTVHQYNPFIVSALLPMTLEDPLDKLPLLGYLGIAGNNHPSSVECTFKGYYPDNYYQEMRFIDRQGRCSFSYDFNNDGTLSSGSCDYDGENSSNVVPYYFPSNFSYSYKEYYGTAGTSFSKSQLVGTWKDLSNDVCVLSANGTCEYRIYSAGNNRVTYKGTWTLSNGNLLTVNGNFDGMSYQFTYYIKSLTNDKAILVTTDDDDPYTKTWYKQ